MKISDPGRLAATRLSMHDFIGYFRTKVFFQLVDDEQRRQPPIEAVGGKGKGRGGAAAFSSLVNGTRVQENMDKWFIGHLWSDALQNMVSLWDNPILENRGWTESDQPNSDYPATMVFVKYVIMTAPLKLPGSEIARDDDGIPLFLHLANREEDPIVIASELQQPLGEGDAPVYKMQANEVPLTPFRPRTTASLTRTRRLASRRSHAGTCSGWGPPGRRSTPRWSTSRA